MNTRDKLYVMEQVDRHNEAAVAGYCAERKAQQIERARQAGATRPAMPREEGMELKRLFAEHANAERELKRMEERRKAMAARKVLDEERRQRFLRRLDSEITEARRRKVEAAHALNVYQSGIGGMRG